jgi:hypothetical protein
LEDQIDVLGIDSYESLKHLSGIRSRALLGKSKRHREMFDLLLRIGHEASCEDELFGSDERLKSNTKNLLSETAISISNDFEKIACSLNLLFHDVTSINRAFGRTPASARSKSNA